MILSRLLLASVLLSFVASRGWAQSTTAAPQADRSAPKQALPQLHVETPVFNVGRVAAGTVLNHTYVFKNTGTAPLILASVLPTCGCAEVETFTARVEPGQTGTIAIRFDSTGIDGAISRAVVIASNDPAQPEVNVMIEGTVYSAITVEPTNVVFASVADATARETKFVRITNNAEEPLVLTAPVSSNPAFVAALQPVHAGREFELSVTAVPPFGTGGMRGEISLQTNSAERPVITVTALVVVQKPVTVVPSVVWAPAAPATQARVTIRNNSGATGFVVSEPVVTLAGVTAVVNEVEAGRVFSVVLTFPPGFVLSPGTQGELTVKTNNPRVPVMAVPIKPAPRRA